MTIDIEKAAQHWSAPPKISNRTRWWQSPTIVKHINKNFCGVPAIGTDGGDIELLKSISGGVLERAVSIGCGTAFHEIKMLQAGIVQHFDLYEIAAGRIKQIEDGAKRAGVFDRITIKTGDPFSRELSVQSENYNLVYWKDSLHHMISARSAVEWSYSVLVKGGVFYMNDYVGPTYMQFSDRQLDMAEKIRSALPERYLIDPNDPSKILPRRRSRPDIAGLIAIDPTECVDSDNIIQSIKGTFSLAKIIPTGGVVYMLALKDVLANIDELADETLLSALMVSDDFCTQANEYLYAVAYAIKPT